MGRSFPFEAEYRHAMALKKAGRQDEATALLGELVGKYPDAQLLRWELGYAQLDAGLPERSIDSFDAAIRLDPECWAAWGGLGHAYTELGEWDLAEQAFRRRLSLRESPNHYIFLCEVLNAKGDYRAALGCVEREVALRPDDAEAYLNLGLTCCNLGHWNDATAAFEKAIALDPEDPRAVAELGFVSFRQNDLQLAEALLRRALASDECEPYVRVYLARTLETKGRYREAGRQLQTALSSAPADDFIRHEYKSFRRRQRKRSGSG